MRRKGGRRPFTRINEKEGRGPFTRKDEEGKGPFKRIDEEWMGRRPVRKADNRFCQIVI